MKIKDALIFWPKKIDLAKFLKVENSHITRFVEYGEIPSCYDAKLKRGIDAKLKKLNRLAEEILK